MKTKNINEKLVSKYKVDNTLLESYFKNAKNQDITGVVFPLRVDNRQYCSPTDYQGDKPSCCGYSTAQILESLNWASTGKVVQFDANQIYAKSKETDKQLDKNGTYPDLALMKGLDLLPNGNKNYVVKCSTSNDVSELKRVIHQNLFASVNLMVTDDIYDLNSSNFVYNGTGKTVGGHSMVCCGYDETSKMFIIQNHWGTEWGLKGFFLCPYSVWEKQSNIICWYEKVEASSIKPEVREVVKEVVKEVVVEAKPEPKKEEVKPEPKKSESKKQEPKKEEVKPEPPKEEPKKEEPPKEELPKEEPKKE